MLVTKHVIATFLRQHCFFGVPRVWCCARWLFQSRGDGKGKRKCTPLRLPHSEAPRVIASQSHDFDTFTWIELRIGQLKLKEECHAEHRNSRERKGLTQVYPHDAFGLHGDFAVVKHIGSIMVRAFTWAPEMQRGGCGCKFRS